MTTNYVSAVDQIFTLIRTAILSSSSAIVGYVPEIRWQGVKEVSTPDASKYWMRVFQETVLEEQITISEENGKRRYENSGLIFVQLFCPESDIAAMQKGRLLSVVARNAFRGKTTSGKVVFRNARIKELPQEAGAFRFNVIAEYEYDEIG